MSIEIDNLINATNQLKHYMKEERKAVGSEVFSVSVSPMWAKTMREKGISPSKAMRDGIALNLALLDKSFPFTPLEEALYNDSRLGAYRLQLAAKIQEIYK